MSKQNIKPHIRWAIRRDVPEVLAIETAVFEFPWSEDDFIRCLRQRNCIGVVIEHKDQVVGFMIYELHTSRLHLLNIAVVPALQRCGLGSLMAQKLASKLSATRRTRVMCEVRERNLAAQMFFKRQGYRAVSVLRDFYDDTAEDAYLFQRRYEAAPGEFSVPVNRISKLAGQV